MATIGMYVFGTSILWGQGHDDDRKIHTQLARRLARRSGTAVRVHHAAHSGAVLKGRAGPGRERLHGEVPDAFPSVEEQVRSAPAAREDRVLVLLDGGINDVGVFRIANPLTPRTTLRQRIRRACRADLRDVLLRIGRKYPAAEVYVLGYYPILAKRSGIARRLELFFSQFNVCEIDDLPGDFADRAIDNSSFFWRESDRQIALAVREAGRQLGGTVRFVGSGFTESEGLFGRTPLVFGLPPADAQMDDRLLPCALALRKGRSGVHCFLAATGHPNRRGVSRYLARLEALVR